MSDNEISVWDLFGILYRHKFTFCFVVLLIMALTVGANIFLPQKFRSEAHLLVRLGRENLGLDSTLKLTNQSSVNVTQSREFELKTVASMIKSHGNFEKVVEDIGVQRILGKRSIIDETKEKIFANEMMAKAFAPSYQLDDQVNAVEELLSKTKVRMIPETHMVGVYYDNSDPHLAREVVNAIVENSLVRHSAAHRSVGSVEFIEGERDRTKAQLFDAEDQLKKFKSESGLISVSEQRATQVSRISSLKSQKMDADSSLAAIKMEIDALEGSLKLLNRYDIDRAVDVMRADLYKLQLKEQELSSKYGDSYALVKQIKGQIASAQKILDEQANRQTQKTMTPSREYQDTNLLLIKKMATRESLEVRSTAIEDQLVDEEKSLVELENSSLEIGRREREIQLLSENYRRYSREAENARVDDSLGKSSLSNLSVAQPATLNYFPVFPNVQLNLALGVVLSLFFGSLTCVLLESWDSRRSRLRQQESTASLLPTELAPQDVPRRTRSAAAIRKPNEELPELAGAFGQETVHESPDIRQPR